MLKVLQHTLFDDGSFAGIPARRIAYAQHAFPRHWDPHYIVQAVERGTVEFWCAGSTWRARAGSLILIDPYGVHTGSSPDGTPVVYSSLYPSSVAFGQILGRSDNGPTFRPPVVYAPGFAGALRRLLSERNASAQGREERLIGLLGRIVERFGVWDRGGPSSGRRLEEVRRRLHEGSAETTRLARLAESVGMSPYHLVRSFRDAYGLPPHQYLVNVRVDNAARMIRAGVPIAVAALEAGFSDQSHLTRCCRRIMGVTPARLRH